MTQRKEGCEREGGGGEGEDPKPRDGFCATLNFALMSRENSSLL